MTRLLDYKGAYGMNSELEDDISERLEDMKKASFHYNWFTMKMYSGEAWFYFKRAVRIKLNLPIKESNKPLHPTARGSGG